MFLNNEEYYPPNRGDRLMEVKFTVNKGSDFWD